MVNGGVAVSTAMSNARMCCTINSCSQARTVRPGNRAACIMIHLPLRGRFGRLFPLWLRCLCGGLVISWVVAIGHWLLVETGRLPREVESGPEYTTSGQAVAEMACGYLTGVQPRDPASNFSVSGYTMIGYGWPVRSLGTLFRQRMVCDWQDGVESVVAVNIQNLWPRSGLPDPFFPSQPAQTVTSRSLGYNGYSRFLPVFPLFGASLVASVFYGLPLYIFFRWREAKRRRGHCTSCGYDVSTLSAGTGCPEYGVGRSAKG